jgi:hypothetical protein
LLPRETRNQRAARDIGVTSEWASAEYHYTMASRGAVRGSGERVELLFGRPVMNVQDIRHARVTSRSLPARHGKGRVLRRVVSLSMLAGLLAMSAGRAWACPPADPLAQRQGTDPAPATRAPQISIALLLDTSNSMDGLIGQAKAQLWSVVNRFRTCRRDGTMPELRIALHEYGNNKLSASEGHIRMVSAFTTDLDSLSEKLFGLQTDGGNEFCGHVIDRATRELSWGTCPGDLNLIFIAGNEPFTQGSVAYADAIASSVRGRIRINTIHCGTYQEGVDGKWRDGATLGQGAYSVIDQSSDVRHISTPFDDEISRLGIEVNETYIPYGSRGKEAQARQSSMDAAPAALPGSAGLAASVERSVAKNSAAYVNTHWDLVDALDKGTVKLESLADEEVPQAMRGLPRAQQLEFVDTKRVRRLEINRRVVELQLKREQFLREQTPEGADTTLGAALLAAIDSQAREAGWTFEAK